MFRLHSLAGWLTAVVYFTIFPSPFLHAETYEDQAKRLLAKLPHADEFEAAEIIASLEEIGPEARAAIPMLLELLTKEEFSIEASAALAAMGAEGIGPLREGLKDKDGIVRFWTLHAVAGMGGDAAPLIADIGERMQDSEEDVRRKAGETLGKLRRHATSAVPMLTKMLDSKDGYAAATAADALLDMGLVASDAIPALLKTAQKHPDAYARCRALTALLVIDEQAEAATAAHAHCLQDTATYGFTFPLSVRRVACENLTLIGAKASKAAPKLLGLLGDDPIRDNIRRYEQTTYMLATLGAKNAIPLLKRDFERELQRRRGGYLMFPRRKIPETYEAVCLRVSAAGALARLDRNNKAAVDYLLEVLQDNQWSVVAPSGSKGATLMDPRALAATNLGLLDRDAARALPALHRAMKTGRTERAKLAAKAAWAIARIDSNDRSCLETLKKASFSHPSLPWAPFFRESPESVATILGDRSSDVAPAIAKSIVFRTSNWLRRYYVEILVRMGDSSVNVLVRRALESIEKADKWNSADLAYLALDDLGERAAPAAKQLADKLKSKNHFVRAEAARMLGVIGGEAEHMVPALTPLLRDQRVLVRVRGAQALARFGPRAASAIERLETLAASDEYQWVRQAATAALRKIRKAM